LLLNPHADRVKGALILYVFAGDSRRNWLRAFKSRRGVEMCALLARVEFKAALEAFAYRFADRGQHRAALSAPGNCMRPGHLHGSGSKGFLFRGAIRRGPLTLLTAITVSITVLPVLLL
jgi:hypothetical protein